MELNINAICHFVPSKESIESLNCIAIKFNRSSITLMQYNLKMAPTVNSFKIVLYF